MNREPAVVIKCADGSVLVQLTAECSRGAAMILDVRDHDELEASGSNRLPPGNAVGGSGVVVGRPVPYIIHRIGEIVPVERINEERTRGTESLA